MVVLRVNQLEFGRSRISPTWARQTWSSEHSLLPQLAPVAVADVADAAVEVEAAQQVEQLQPAEPLAHRHRPEPVVVVADGAADAAVTVALPIRIRSRHFADQQLNRGFHFSPGRRRSTITTRLMR